MKRSLVKAAAFFLCLPFQVSVKNWISGNLVGECLFAGYSLQKPQKPLEEYG